LGGSLEIKPNQPGTMIIATIPLKEEELDDRPAAAA
jgi:hypothetical protein